MSYTELQCKTILKSRKSYRCEWCDTTIEQGTKHQYRAYIWENDFQTGRMHEECFEAMSKSPYDLVSEGWTPGEAGRGECLS